jgi:hypothetical protein
VFFYFVPELALSDFPAAAAGAPGHAVGQLTQMYLVVSLLPCSVPSY